MKKTLILMVAFWAICTSANAQQGATNINVTDTQSGQTATKEVTVTDNKSTTDSVAVDLGLPSGTLWADRNIGAKSPEDYGGYYAWGETKEKNIYKWNTYKWCKGSLHTQTKYCTKSEYGTVDNKTKLDSEDDVAHVKWGGSWQIPTRDQAKELLVKCKSKWTTVNGVKGYKFTGPNGNSIFLPAAGYRNGEELSSAGTSGNYWLSEGNSIFANDLHYLPSEKYWPDGMYRYYGLSVRPVRSK